MQLTDCGCNSPCLDCQHVAPTPCTKDKCRKSLETTKIAQLVWLQGLDENLCERFMRLVDAVKLRDCAGNAVTLETPVVLCSDFKAQLCAALSGLASGGEAVPDVTQLVGADCKLYTVPAAGEVVETPNAVVDTTTIDFSATGTLNRTISGAVKVSGDVDNIVEVHADGLYVPASAVVVPTACAQLQAFPVGDDITAGTVLIGADCQKHVFPGIPSPGFTVSDTSSVDLVLTGTNLEANVKLDPAGLGTITGNGILVTCAEVLDCAPPVTVLDTISINLSLVGQLLSADAVISPDPANALELHGNGLYVDVCSALDDGLPPVPAVVGTTVLVGADCNRYTIPAAVPLVGGVTPTASTTVAANVVTANVLIDPDNDLIVIGNAGLQVTCEDVQDCVFGINNNFWNYNDLGNVVSFFPSTDVGNQIGVGSDGRPFVPAAALTVSDTNCISPVLLAGNLTINPIISAEPNNGILCLADGLFSPTGNANIQGLATNCFQTTVTPGPNNSFTIQVFPIIQASPNNALVCTPTGLFVPNAVVQAADTNCINMTVLEGPAGTFTVSAVPIISPAANNALTCTPTGLFSAYPQIVAEDTDCLNVTITGAGTAVQIVRVDPVISPIVGNTIQCTPNGLFAAAAAVDVQIAAVDTNTLDLTVVEGPDNVFQVSGDVIVSPDAGNSLVAQANGLFVCDTNIVAVDTPCLNLDVIEGPACTWSITGNPIIDPDPCNSLVCNPAGMFVPPPATSSSDFVAVGQQFLAVPLPAGNSIQTPDLCLNVVNPSACRSATLQVTLRNPATSGTFNGTPWQYSVTSEVLFNFPGVSVTPFVVLNSWPLSSGFGDSGTPAADVTFSFVVPPGFAGNYCMHWRLDGNVGTPLVNLANARLTYILTTI